MQWTGCPKVSWSPTLAAQDTGLLLPTFTHMKQQGWWLGWGAWQGKTSELAEG